MVELFERTLNETRIRTLPPDPPTTFICRLDTRSFAGPLGYLILRFISS